MQIYKIEKGIKVPKPNMGGRADGQPGKVALTLQALAKGDSFLIKDALEALKGDKVVRDRNRRERQRGGDKEFVSRRDGNGLRVWRVK